MSVESEILRIQHNIANAYATVAEKGGEVPLQATSSNLAAAVASIQTGVTQEELNEALTTKQDKLTGQPGQVVGFDTDGAAVAVPGWGNPNLLLNWDFRNPVNRNGQTEYAQGGFTIDMWCGSNCSVRMEDGGIVVSQLNNSSDAHFYMPSFSGKFLTGKTVTLSVIVDEIDGTCNINGFGAVKSLIPGINFLTATAEEESRFWILNYLNGTIKIRAAKLELGPVQTLARQDTDGNWVLNDPPDYALQYALCSLYSPITGEWVGSQHSNPNLLDNWYFVDPVNQRGQTEYTGEGYTIDRWFLFNSPSAKLLESGVQIKGNPNGAQFIQRFSLENIKEDTLLTLSFLDTNGELTVCTGKAKRNKELSFWAATSWGWVAFRNLPSASFWESVYHTTVDKILVAAKLELGPVQTLAHKEGDTWVLNDPPPNKVLELAKCQRYAKIFRQNEAFTVFRVNPNYIDFLVPVGIKMRSTPTIIGTGWGEYLTNGFTLTVAVNGASQIMLRATKTNHGLSNPSPMTMRDSVSGFSSDL